MLKEGSGTAIEGGVDEMTQIKILQILLIFLNPKTLRITKEFVDLVSLSYPYIHFRSSTASSVFSNQNQMLLNQLYKQPWGNFSRSFSQLLLKSARNMLPPILTFKMSNSLSMDQFRQEKRLFSVQKKNKIWLPSIRARSLNSFSELHWS
jgi:hypothetical protein